MINPMNPWRLTIILLSILSLFSCDRDNDNELTVHDLGPVNTKLVWQLLICPR